MAHPKRPRDPNRLAKSIIDIATGQKPDRTPEELGKSAKAVAVRFLRQALLERGGFGLAELRNMAGSPD